MRSVNASIAQQPLNNVVRVTVQALGWVHGREPRYLPLRDDIASVAYWYQTLPTAPFPDLPGPEALEVN